ncbi:MAG TPA: hypothetical protein VFN64_05780 [Burkholderiaceae bacterium]|nr:hypothetical protein [Burkholderiaceae bacterium]
MASLTYLVVTLVTLFALLLWARRRVAVMRMQSAAREQQAMEMQLAACIGAAAGVATPASASRAASSAVDAAPAVHANAGDSNAVEHAAAGMDPIEELISHIVVDSAPAAKKPLVVAARQRLRRWSAPLSVRYPSEADSIAAGVPLRELVIAWYESRGYRGSPASPAVWPIELVLRHRDDAARAYAFVVQNDYVSVDRITALIEQAREIGMLRVAIVAQAGYERGAKAIARKRHVRLIDRSTMEAEFLALELPTAAKIIGVARKRAAEAVPAAA